MKMELGVIRNYIIAVNVHANNIGQSIPSLSKHAN